MMMETVDVVVDVEEEKIILLAETMILKPSLGPKMEILGVMQILPIKMKQRAGETLPTIHGIMLLKSKNRKALEAGVKNKFLQLLKLQERILL